MSILFLSELIDKDGSRIGGDMPINQIDNMTTSKLTTDDFIRMSRQPKNADNEYGLGYRVYYGENDDTNDDLETPEKEFKKPKKPKKSKKSKNKIKENSRIKMNSLIEDIFTKKDFDREFIDKVKDLRLNGIQNIDAIRDTNPILIRKVSSLKELIEKNNATGEEKAILLNFLLDMDMSDIPVEYKEELKKKFK